MLLSGRCEVLGLAEGGPEPQFGARELEESEDRAVCVVGRPPADAIREAARRNRDTASAVAVAGFGVISLEEFDFPAMPRIVWPHVIGCAERPAA
jgi:hypothetical protein